jgi:hypothetical protein
MSTDNKTTISYETFQIESLKEELAEITDELVRMRDHISKVDPEYTNEWLGEFVNSPKACAARIVQWMTK